MRTVKALLAAGLIAGLPAAAHAQWYAGVDAGVNFIPDADTSSSATNYDGSYQSETGYAGLAQFGYSFGGPKAEFEVGYRRNGIDGIRGVDGGDGRMSSLAFMANGIYEFLPQSKWHPFIGAGIGYADVIAKAKTGTGGRWVDDEDWQFAYQGMAGVSYDVTRNWAVKAQYRYFATLDPDFKDVSGNKVDSEYSSHSVLVGFTYKFNPPAPPPPAPAPVAAPAPTPAPAPMVKPAPAPQKNYMVFFDFNKADITPEAAQIIAQASNAAKAGHATRVDLTGHADRSGSDKYNMALSLKRANAVKDAMVRQGIPAAQISVVAKGESAPLVPTPDGVREPQNRRVEIVLP